MHTVMTSGIVRSSFDNELVLTVVNDYFPAFTVSKKTVPPLLSAGWFHARIRA